MEIVGIQYFNYTSKKTGNVTPSCRIHAQYMDENVDGVACEVIFCPVSTIEGERLKVGESIHVSYNKWGSVDYVRRIA